MLFRSALLFMAQISVPRSVLIMSPVILLIIMGGNRLAYRAWKEKRLAGFIAHDRNPVFVIGVADAAAGLVMELARSPQWKVAGVFNFDNGMKGSELHGVRVLGDLTELSAWKEKLQVTQAIIAMPEASHTQRRIAVDACSRAGLQVQTVPSFDDLLSGKVTVSQIRHVELDDLLGRDPVTLDTRGLRDWIADHVVLVTGAGGSIGSELCRQLARFNPKQLILLEINEFGLYSIEQEFVENHPQLKLVFAIGDVKDESRVDDLIRRYRPNVIFHAAAYKHVPLMESNPQAAVRNNVFGTQVLVDLADRFSVQRFVMISTDKAVRPTNIMGATKLIAEEYLFAVASRSKTRFITVRFGNVLNSAGSVVPTFRRQIEQGGPVTVTDPEMERYFMTIPEAVQLVLQSGAIGAGGDVLILDMGEPVRIVDLAKDMIRLSGQRYPEDIDIVFTGLRPGEKLFEELFYETDRKSTRLNSSHIPLSRMPSSA